MIDFNRWIYSNDIAVWLAQNASLTLEEQIDCICAAPHRTLEEKLEGVKELKSEYDGNEFQDRIEIIERVLHNSRSDAVRDPYLFGIEVFYKGEKDCFLPDMIFHTAKEARIGICHYIEKAAEKDHLERKNWYGVVKVFRRADSLPHGFVPIMNMVIRYDGEVIYVQNMYNYARCSMPEGVDMGYFDTVKVPYPSGTIIAIPENPYIPEWKGVLVNIAEPDEENFSDELYNQWLVYPTAEHGNQTHGIGFVNLRDDYIPFENSPDFIFPYKQLIRVYEGSLKENETWLSEFGALVKVDKNCIRKLLDDREPKKSRCSSVNEERLKYVRELTGK